jgi:hypothetical protein
MPEDERQVGPQATLWFVLAVVGIGFTVWLLYSRYVRKDPQTVRSGNGFFIYAACVLLFSAGALIAGFVSAAAGR